MAPKSNPRAKTTQSIRDFVLSKDMELPSLPSPTKRKAVDVPQYSLGYKTDEYRADAHARLKSLRHMLYGGTAPSPAISGTADEPSTSSQLLDPPSTTSQTAPDPDPQGGDGYTDYQIDGDYMTDYAAGQTYVHSTNEAPKLAIQQVDVLPAKSAVNLEQRFATAFEALLPVLEEPYLRYVLAIQNGAVPENIPHQEQRPCDCSKRVLHERIVKCYMFKGKLSIKTSSEVIV